MKIAIVQPDFTVGDFSGNRQKIIQASQKAAGHDADMVVFPELCICGSPVHDLPRRKDFLRDNAHSLAVLQRELPGGIAVVLGHAAASEHEKLSGEDGAKNMISVVRDREVVHQQEKILLSGPDSYNESRVFSAGRNYHLLDLKGKKILFAPGLLEPYSDPAASSDFLNVPGNAELIIVPSASPFFSGKHELRLKLAERLAEQRQSSVIFVNYAGGNEGFIYDGNSFILDASSRVRLQCRGFHEDLAILAPTDKTSSRNPGINRNEDLQSALVLGIRDYLRKCGFSRAHLGVSGGIDSALTTVLAVKALGPESVKPFYLPSRYSSEKSRRNVSALCGNLNLELTEISIDELYAHFLTSLQPLFRGTEEDETEENLQARIRGTLLMAYSNKHHSLLLSAGNKSELACGYVTLYGDMSGGLDVLGDVLKTQVYDLAHFIQQKEELFPPEVLEREPSAELKPDQTDSDILPPFDILDPVLELSLSHFLPPEQIIQRGFPGAEVRKILAMVTGAEYKRRQAPPSLIVSRSGFITGQKFPICSHDLFPSLPP